MIKKRRIIDIGIALLSGLAITSCIATTRESQVETAISLTREHFKNTATIKDDSLDTTATITTVNGFQGKRGLLGIVWDDNFLRAFIDKKTGRTTFQLYQIIYCQGRGWDFFQTVNYQTLTGVESHPVTVIERDVDCRSWRTRGCLYTEHIGFDVDEKLLRTVAADYQSGQRWAWKFKLNAKSGRDYTDGVLPAEIAGLLDKVDEYVTSRGLPQSTTK